MLILKILIFVTNNLQAFIILGNLHIGVKIIHLNGKVI